VEFPETITAQDQTLSERAWASFATMAKIRVYAGLYIPEDE
jgi:hypothetical protein